MSIRQKILWGLLVIAVVGVVGTAVWTWYGVRTRENKGGRPLEGLKVFGTVPDFSLIERSGRTVTLDDLRGHVWIADFIFTNCANTCPSMTAQMRRVQL